MRRFFPIVLFTLCVSPSLYALPGSVIRDLPAPGQNCTGLAFDGTAGGRVWVADHALDELLAVDPRTGKVQKRFKSPGYRPGDLRL